VSRRALLATFVLGVLGGLASGCRPDLVERTSLVDAPRILAVRGEPAEARPGEAVTYTALVAAPDGSSVTELRWATCLTPKPLAEPSIVSSACLSVGGVEPANATGPTAATATIALPSAACSLFGPEPPPGGYRPRAPDPTGGYYVPIRAALALPDAEPAFLLERVSCSLGDAAVDLARTFAMTYVANLNPASPIVVVSRAGAVVTEGDTVSMGARLEVSLSWRAEDAETYVYFDRTSQTLTTKREWMRASWFASTGTFEVDHSGRDEGDAATTLANAWRAPAEPGVVHLWLVLHDARGGAAWAARDVRVE
jgi:hypothetical protein